MGSCNAEYNLYWTFVIISLLLTLAVVIYANKQKGFCDNPSFGKKFYGTLAGFKILLGVLLLTVLYPKDCVNFQSFYGIVAIIIGAMWVARAKKCADMEASASGAAEMPAVAVKQEIV